MAEDKYQRVVRLFPRTFRPVDGDEIITNLPAAESTGMTIAELWNANVGNPVVNAILRGFAGADQTISEQIQETKASLFVRTAENNQLDVIASSLGVSRPAGLGLPDAAFQALIPPLSLRAKQVRQSFYNAMDAFWGPEFSRANLESLNTTISTFDLRIGDGLTFNVDGGTDQTIVIRSTSGIVTEGAATALELNNLLKDNLTGITTEILTDPITKIETVRIRTNTPGLRGSIKFTDGRLTTTFPTRTDIFSTTIAELIKQQQRTVIYEIRPNEVVIEIPAFIPTLARGLKGSLHVHNGSLVNNIIDRGFTTNYILPSDLFKLNPLSEYSVTNDPRWAASEAVYEPTDDSIVQTRTLRLIPAVNRDPGVYEFIVNNLRQSTITTSSVAIQPTGSLVITGLTDPSNRVLEPIIVPLPTAIIDDSPQNAGSFIVGAQYSIFSIGDTDFRLVGAESNSLGEFFTATAVGSGTGVAIPVLDDLNSYTTKLRNAVASSSQNMADDGGGTLVEVADIPLDKFPGVEISIVGNALTIKGALVSQATPALNLDLTLSDTFKFFVRVENPLDRSADTEIWRGAFLFDPNGTQSTFTVTGQSAEILGDAVTGQSVLAAGQVHPRITVNPATNTLPTDSQLAIVGFGTSTQETALIRYRGRASDNIVELDPSFVFTQTQPSGTFINIISAAAPFVPDRVGNAYPIYVTSSSSARVTIQNILQTLAAAGVVVNFVVIAPDYKYLIDNPFLDTDDSPGSGTAGQQTGYKYIIDDPTTSGDESPSV